MSKMTGAKILVESLKRENVEMIFGYPGGTVIQIYDELYDADIKHYLTRHEQGAVHAADGYASSSGKVGVCLVTSGPGATNLVTGLATAYMDSVPLVAFTGQVSTEMIGRDAFQEADIRGISMPITKYNYLVTDVKDLARTIKEAFYIARTGRPGPVLIDVPKDVSMGEAEFNYPEQVDLPGYKPTYKGHGRQIKKAAQAINKARKPLLYVGGGAIISEAASEVRQLIDKAQIPITTTLMALGIYPEDKPLALGMLGMHGTRYANYATGEADLLIAVGARFDDRVTGELESYATEADVIHIDIDPAEIGKNVGVEVPIVGDVKKVLKKLIPLVDKREEGPWQKQIAEMKEDYPLEYEDDGHYIKPQYVMEEIYRMTEGEAIISTEVGQNQMWAAQYYKYSHPRSFVTSGGLGTMGYGFPAAIGAQLGNPEREVILIAGDGSFQMNMQEMATISSYRIPVKVVIMNNQSLGMVRQWQELFFDKRYSSTVIKNPDFVQLAKGFDIYGQSIDRKKDVIPALEELRDVDGPAILEVKIPTEENVYPMVPPGAGIVDMIGGK